MYLYSISLKIYMKAAIVKDTAKISVDDVSKPTLGNGDILVRMESCGICGSDLEKVFGKYGQPSMRLGHEPAGVIIDVGTSVSEFKKGDRVFTHHHVPCYDCHYCKHGFETMCPKYYETNLSPCGLSEEYVVPEWNVRHGGVLKIPDNMSFEEAAMIEPLACCIRSWKKIKYLQGDSVGIFGVGPTGMMHVMLAQTYGFGKIFCFDINDFRLDFATKFGITKAVNTTKESPHNDILLETSNLGLDVAIVATGSIKALENAVDFVRKGGTVMMFGVPSKNAIMNLDISKVYSKEVTLVTSYAASDYDTKDALNLIKDSKIDVKKLITHRYTLADTQKAFEHAHKGHDAMKIIITK